MLEVIKKDFATKCMLFVLTAQIAVNIYVLLGIQ